MFYAILLHLFQLSTAYSASSENLLSVSAQRRWLFHLFSHVLLLLPCFGSVSGCLHSRHPPLAVLRLFSAGLQFLDTLLQLVDPVVQSSDRIQGNHAQRLIFHPNHRVFVRSILVTDEREDLAACEVVGHDPDVNLLIFVGRHGVLHCLGMRRI